MREAQSFLLTWSVVSAIAWALGAALLWVGWRSLSGTTHAQLAAVAAQPLEGRRCWLVAAVLIAGLLLIVDGRGFAHGFFRYDDFAFVADARTAGSFGEYLRMYHNDHSLPLYRLQVWSLLKLAGPESSAAQLAVLFNLSAFVTFFLLLGSGLWVLTLLGVGRLAAACFVALLWFWPGWGEFVAGFYTLLGYPQTVVLGFAALGVLLHFSQKGGTLPVVGLFLLTLACTLLILPGVWAVPALLAFALALPGTVPPARRRLALAAVAAAGVVALVYHAGIAPHAFTPRELVQNPSGGLANTSVMHNLRQYGLMMPVRFLSGLGGVFVSGAVPPLLERLPLRPQFTAGWNTAVSAAEIAGCIAVVGAGLALLRGPDRRWLLAAGVALAVPVAMVVLARVNLADMPGSFWPAKYKCISYCWFALAVALLLDRRFRLQRTAGAPLLATALLLGATAWACLAEQQLERRLALQLPWWAGGREHNVAMARLRRDDYARLLADTGQLATALRTTSVSLPAGTVVAEPYPSLELGTDAVRGANYQFLDLYALGGDRSWSVQRAPVNQLDEPTQRALAGIPRLARLYATAAPTPTAIAVRP